MRRLAIVGLIVVTSAQLPLGVIALAVLVLMQSFLSIVIAPLLLTAVVVTFVTFWSLRPSGDGPRPAFGVAGLAALQGIVLAVGVVSNSFAAAIQGGGFFDLLGMMRGFSLVVAIGLVIDAGLIALLASVVQSTPADGPMQPLSPLVRKRLLFGALSLALVVAVMFQWQVAKDGAAAEAIAEQRRAAEAKALASASTPTIARKEPTVIAPDRIERALPLAADARSADDIHPVVGLAVLWARATLSDIVPMERNMGALFPRDEDFAPSLDAAEVFARMLYATQLFPDDELHETDGAVPQGPRTLPLDIVLACAESHTNDDVATVRMFVARSFGVDIVTVPVSVEAAQRGFIQPVKAPQVVTLPLGDGGSSGTIERLGVERKERGDRCNTPLRADGIDGVDVVDAVSVGARVVALPRRGRVTDARVKVEPQPAHELLANWTTVVDGPTRPALRALALPADVQLSQEALFDIDGPPIRRTWLATRSLRTLASVWRVGERMHVDRVVVAGKTSGAAGDDTSRLALYDERRGRSLVLTLRALRGEVRLIDVTLKDGAPEAIAQRQDVVAVFALQGGVWTQQKAWVQFD